MDNLTTLLTRFLATIGTSDSFTPGPTYPDEDQDFLPTGLHFARSHCVRIVLEGRPSLFDAGYAVRDPGYPQTGNSVLAHPERLVE